MSRMIEEGFQLGDPTIGQYIQIGLGVKKSLI
jgi:hypothetical protein